MYLTASNISALTTLWYNRWLHSGLFVLKILWIYFTLLKLIISWISALGIPQPFTNIRGHYWWMCQNWCAMHTFPNFFIQSSLIYVRVCFDVYLPLWIYSVFSTVLIDVKDDVQITRRTLWLVLFQKIRILIMSSV